MFSKKNKNYLQGKSFGVYGIYDSVLKNFVVDSFLSSSVDGAKRSFAIFLDPIGEDGKIQKRRFKAGTFLLCQYKDFDGHFVYVCDDTAVSVLNYMNEPEAETGEES